MHDAEYYSKLGFKCGLEIHQRLATSEKLFCGCSADYSSASEIIQEIERRQRAVAGELGLVDESTRFESRKERRFLYHLFRKNTCLVDTDEEPPGKPNMDAFCIAILMSLSLNCSVPDEVEPMRKEVVDGSDPSAFQRSMLCGYDGWLDVSGKRISIPSIFLEEESSGIISSSTSEVVYSVDRMGIPLIEIDTDPVIATPQEAKEVAMRIGLMLRLTGMVQRGIGSIRQDVNISIKEGRRVEIKGLQEIESVDEIIENEVHRQVRLVEIMKELKQRKVELGKPIDVGHVFQGSEAKVIGEQMRAGGTVLGVRLSGFKGFLGREIGPNLRLGSEISDYAKMAEVRGVIHSDENLSSSYSISQQEIERLRKALKIGDDDAFILVAEKKERCERAMELALMRARLALDGVPSETRGTDARNKTTRFLRPIPGGSRMYPETDALPIDTAGIVNRVGTKRVDIEQVRSRLQREIENKQLAEQMLWSRELQQYEQLVKETGVEPRIVASILLEKFRELSRSGIAVDKLSREVLSHVFGKYAKGEITRLGMEEILKSLPEDKKSVDSRIKERKLERLSKAELNKLVEKHQGKGKNDILREIMSKYRMVVDAGELASMLDGK